MSNHIENALSDINIIKNSINSTKNNTHSLYKIFFVYGFVNLIYYILTMVSSSIFKISTVQIYFNLILNLFIYLFLGIFYIKIYLNEKSNLNKYYKSFLNIWILITLILPILIFVTRISLIFINEYEKINLALIQLKNFEIISNTLLLLFCLVLSRYILNRKSITYISILLLFIYLIISTIYNNTNITLINNLYISLQGLFYYVITSIGYIMLGLILKYGDSKKNGIK